MTSVALMKFNPCDLFPNQHYSKRETCGSTGADVETRSEVDHWGGQPWPL